MRGIIFTQFSKLVDNTFGIETWENVLDNAQPLSGGIYTAGKTYDDNELYSLISNLSKIINTDQHKLILIFGEFLLLQFARLYPHFFTSTSAKDFLKSIDEVIHKEVKKLHPDAQTPEFKFLDPSPDKLILFYKSPRKLCALAEGLIHGTSKYYKTKIEITHSQCMHKGEECCKFELEFLRNKS